jgi:hypothetical protein
MLVGLQLLLLATVNRLENIIIIIIIIIIMGGT